MLAAPDAWLDEMVKLFEGDCEYEIAANIEVTEYAPTVKEYTQIAETFYRTIARIRALHALPINLTAHIQLNAAAHASASAKAGYDPIDIEYDPATERHAQDAKDALRKVLATIETGYKGGLDAYFFETGASVLKTILKNDLDEGSQGTSAATIGIDAMLAAIITAGYAALETMAEDLWIAAANHHDSLGMNWLRKNRRQFDGDVFASYGPNFSGRLGTFLTESRKVTFTCMDEIKKAYLDSFGPSIEDGFRFYKDVWHAEKVRHLIAHRAGIVDAKFKREIEGLPEYRDVQIGQQIPLNGQIVLNHLLVCVVMGQALLKIVDEWSSVAPTM